MKDSATIPEEKWGTTRSLTTHGIKYVTQEPELDTSGRRGV